MIMPMESPQAETSIYQQKTGVRDATPYIGKFTLHLRFLELFVSWTMKAPQSHS